jgi:WD40 repeat protein
VTGTEEAEASLRQAVFQSSVRVRHDTGGAGAKSVAVSRDNRLLATANDTGRIDVWNPTTGVTVRELVGHSKATTIVALPAGEWLTASQDGTVRRFASGASTGRILYRGKPLTAIASTPDGTTFAAGDETGVMRLFRQGEARPRIVRKIGDSIRSLAIDPKASTVAAGTGGKLTLIPTSGAPPLVVLRTQRDEGVSGLDYSPDGERLAIATTSGSVLIRSRLGGGVVHLRGHSNKVSSVRFSRDGRRVTTSGAFDNSVRVWSAQGGPALAVLNGHAGTANDAAFDGADRIVSGADDGTARVWAWASGRPQTYVIPGKVGLSVGGIAISPDGTTAMTVLANGSAIGIDTSTGATRPLTDPQSQPVAISEIARDGESGTFAREDGTIVVTRLAHAAPIDHHFDGAKGHYVYGVRRSADGDRLAVLTDAGDLLVHRFSDERTTKLKAIPGSNDLDMTDDGSTLATASASGVTRVWSAGSLAPTLELPTSGAEDYAVALSPGAPLVASGGAGRTVTVWNRESGRQVARLVGHSGVIYGMTFSPDGSRLMSLGNDGALIWDTATWRLILRIPLPQAFSGAFGPDGRLVTASLAAVSSSDYAVKTWRCEVCGTIDEVRRLATLRATRELTTNEADRFLGGLRP